jgi:hypothetical protein
MSVATAADPVVAQIDHLLILADDADGLVRLFTETFEIPLAWAMADWGPAETAGVRPLNLNLEFIRPNERFGPLARQGQPTRIVGIGLEPARSVVELLTQLDARGIPHRTPSTRPGWTWTTVGLPDFLPEHTVLFCAYAPETVNLSPEYRTERLRERGGGPLGVERVREVVAGVPDRTAAIAHWGRLLVPHSTPETGVWELGAGPALRLEAAPETTIARVVLQVRDLDQAVTFLRSRNLLGESDGRRATIAPDCLGSLQIHLVAEPVPR